MSNKEIKLREELKDMLLEETDNRFTVITIQSKIDELCLEVFSRAYEQASMVAIKVAKGL